MDKFTETRQRLGKALYAQLSKYRDTITSSLRIGRRIEFFSEHFGADATYTSVMGFRYDNGDGLMAVRMNFKGVEDAVSQRTTVEDMETCIKYMPLVEKFLELEAPHPDEYNGSFSSDDE